MSQKIESSLRNLTITTRNPGKWIAVDLETGDVWRGSRAGWDRADEAALQEVEAVLAKRLRLDRQRTSAP